MKEIQITAGKVPGAGVETMVLDATTNGAPTNVFDALTAVAAIKNFKFSKEVYKVDGKDMVDVPFLNGRELSVKEIQQGVSVITSVLWNTPVDDGDTVLLVPMLKGNQFIVEVARVPGNVIKVALLEEEHNFNHEEGVDTVAAALGYAGLEVGENDEVFVNDEPAKLDDQLEDGDKVRIRTKVAPPTVEASTASSEEKKKKKWKKVFESDGLVIKTNRDKTKMKFIAR